MTSKPTNRYWDIKVFAIVVVIALIGTLVALWMFSANSQEVTGQETPQKLLSKWEDSILDADRRRFIECYYPTSDDYRDMVAAQFDAVQAYYAFAKAVESAYGSGAMLKYEEIDADYEVGFVNVPKRRGTFRTVNVDVSGNVAYFDNPISERRARLVLKGGQWFYDASYEVKKPDAVTPAYSSLEKAFLWGATKAREKSMSLLELKEALGRGRWRE